eukprot:CAMPEP_0170191134 /NCGR_PEP_ID=MMETSP0040_2-20121228/50946_1 /TAXON_ID=641309 /ORGANISM="Lotharella oceanica, Strain CCMP622" /LENGTH=37 /DNA_ID= /DNA_START= /DNA_END= /DNA_ORIENTATION=
MADRMLARVASGGCMSPYKLLVVQPHDMCTPATNGTD